MAELADEADNIIVIVTTKNVFDHTKIAYQLSKSGFRQCIYKPLPILQRYSNDEFIMTSDLRKLHGSGLVNVSDIA